MFKRRAWGLIVEALVRVDDALEWADERLTKLDSHARRRHGALAPQRYRGDRGPGSRGALNDRDRLHRYQQLLDKRTALRGHLAQAAEISRKAAVELDRVEREIKEVRGDGGR